MLNHCVKILETTGVEHTIPCREDFASQDYWNKLYSMARVLIEACGKLPMLEKNKNYLVEQPSTSRGNPGGGSDSDDEPVPYPPNEQPFTNLELAVVNYTFTQLKNAYTAAKAVGFVNCCGKAFFVELCRFTYLVKLGNSPHKALLSTGKGCCQPGAFFINWEVPSRPLRSNQTSNTIQNFERYADCVSYNKTTFMNEIVTDNSSSDEEHTLQHNEQMVGLWKPGQQVMLGFEFYTKFVIPKVLVRQKNSSGKDILCMLCIKKMDLNNDMGILSKLIIAFTYYVCISTSFSHSQ